MPSAMGDILSDLYRVTYDWKIRYQREGWVGWSKIMQLGRNLSPGYIKNKEK